MTSVFCLKCNAALDKAEPKVLSCARWHQTDVFCAFSLALSSPLCSLRMPPPSLRQASETTLSVIYHCPHCSPLLGSRRWCRAITPRFASRSLSRQSVPTDLLSCCQFLVQSEKPPQLANKCALTFLSLSLTFFSCHYSALAKCQSCDKAESLWLCLTCGALGCARKE